MEGAENKDMIEEKRMKSQLLCVTRRFGKSETPGEMETWAMCGVGKGMCHFICVILCHFNSTKLFQFKSVDLNQFSSVQFDRYFFEHLTKSR